MSSSETPAWVYVGTQRAGPHTGFSVARLDTARGILSPFALVEPADDPAFFVLTRDGRRLYTCNAGTPGGVSAFDRDTSSGRLTPQGHHVSTGRGPSQLSLDATEQFVLAANYGGGYVEVIAITPEGGLGPQTAFVRHEGRSIDPVRQTRPYAHAIVTDPTNQFALVADLGLDRVLVYAFDPARGELSPWAAGGVTTEPGSGPRHLAWHPNGRWVYVVEEIANRVSLMEWDSSVGRLHLKQSVPTLPAGFTGENTAAEIRVHASGQFLYASNRGHDSIAAFAIDAAEGTLTARGHTPGGGRTPRYMTFDPSGRWLLVVNVDSDGVATFLVDAGGGLTATGGLTPAPKPYGIAIASAVAPGRPTADA